jgi:ribosomal protein L22
MADEKDPKKQNAEAEDKPKRRRSAGARKDAESTERKPARRRAPARAKGEDRAEGEKPASKPRRRTPARAKQGDAPKAETKSKAEPKAKPKAKAEADADAETTPRQPARRRSARPAAEPKGGRPAPVRPVVTARAKYVRSSARKARLVIDHVRGKPIDEARALLRHSPRGVARDLERLLESAIANAENNHDLVGDELLVKEIYADEGPTLKRFRARAQGRAYRIRKRTSHLTVTLTPKE